MSNLDSAKAAIKAELAQAREAVAQYESLIAALEDALARLESVGSEGGKLPKSKLVAVGTPRRGRPAGKSQRDTSAAYSGELPGTRKDFWVDLVDTTPKSAVEVVQAAVDKIGGQLGRDQVKKLSQRATYALATMVKSGEIQDSGNGRERRYFRAA